MSSTPLLSAPEPLAWIDSVVRHEPERLLIETTDGRRFSYAGFDTLARTMAVALHQRGVAPGDRVCAQVDKSPEAVALYVACLYLGAIYVPLNTAYTRAELDYFLSDAMPRVAVVPPAGAVALTSTPSLIVETLDDSGDGSLMTLASQTSQTQVTYSHHDPDQVAALLYTSGTTGRSKGAMLTRGNLASNAATLARAWQFSAADVLLHALPIFHVHGLFVAINTVLAAGCSMLFLRRFDARETVRNLERATVMMGVPTFYTRLLQEPGLDRAATSNVRLFISGSAPLLPETHRQFAQRTGHAILERYGMSETLMNTSNPVDGERIPGSVGPALPGVEMRITDPQSGVPLAGSEAVGMIEVRGPNVFRGYWQQPEKTAAEIREDGFFITGDLGRIDARGYVYIVGRGKDLVISGGYNVYPIEVETEIDALPGVLESAVIGVAHADFGEGVVAVVVRRNDATIDETGIRAALQTRLANYKVPKRVVFVAELPRNSMGKVQKNLLRENWRDLFVVA